MIARVFLVMAMVVAGLFVTISLRAPGPAPTADHSLSGTQTVAEGFHDHLLTVQAAADALIELGETRERNLLVVRQRQSAMNAALDSTDAWLSQQDANEDDDAVTSYHQGAALIRESMADAQSAFFRFDWDGVAAANVTLQAGTNQISDALSHLDSGDTHYTGFTVTTRFRPAAFAA